MAATFNPGGHISSRMDAAEPTLGRALLVCGAPCGYARWVPAHITPNEQWAAVDKEHAACARCRRPAAGAVARVESDAPAPVRNGTNDVQLVHELSTATRLDGTVVNIRRKCARAARYHDKHPGRCGICRRASPEPICFGCFTKL